MNISNISDNHVIRDSDLVREKHIKSTIVSHREDSAIIGEESRIVANLSIELRQIQKIMSPEIEALRHNILMGSYRVSSEEIARSILFGPPKPA